MGWKIFKIYSLLLSKNILLKNSMYNVTPFRLKIAIHLVMNFWLYIFIQVWKELHEITMVTSGNRDMVDIYFLTSHSYTLFEKL